MKSILFAALILATAVCFGQSENTYKANSGDLNIEVNFAPGSASPININYIRLRKFNEDGGAVRFGGSLNIISSSPDKDNDVTTFTVNIRPGGEMHFAGTDRLSPYIGGEADIAIKSSKYSGPDGYEITGALDDLGTEQGFLRIGGYFIMGCDYYIAKKLYLGTEFGIGFEFLDFADISDSEDFIDIKGGSLIQFGPTYNGFIRLGYIISK